MSEFLKVECRGGKISDTIDEGCGCWGGEPLSWWYKAILVPLLERVVSTKMEHCGCCERGQRMCSVRCLFIVRLECLLRSTERLGRSGQQPHEGYSLGSKIEKQDDVAVCVVFA